MSIKNIVDCHVHSNFSPDSRVSPHDLILAAKKMGLGGITVTDHVDLEYPHRTLQHFFDFKERSVALHKLHAEFSPTFKVLQGIELGFQSHVKKNSSKILQENYFDFVINSTHVVDGIDVCRRPLNESWTKKQVYQRYLETVYESVHDFDDFDVVGHIGFITRYVTYEDPSLLYKDYADIIDMILKIVIQKGKGLEVNTAGYAYKLNTPHPGYDILQRYRELGGSILSIGSDAHTLAQIGGNFAFVLQKLGEIGFEYVCYFEQRKPVFVKIFS